ncbi:uncharacterized protein wu:fj29h11 isoform X2 [Pristis pectinata]|uniref:uncharacterized protein wu:fj29h11 isoform X2 n=1 Tax=Pristis pectinata TaxID=685728 RepID=UPI00223DF2A5|nr:uncharacterized protein wu:fj29h11 isoform X2 [Pristis pectinata]
MDLLRQEISELCIAHPEGFPLSQLSSLYLQMYERPLQLSDYGLQSLTSMLEHMKDMTNLHRDGQNLIISPADRTKLANYGCPPISATENMSLGNQPEIQMQTPVLHLDDKRELLKIELQRLVMFYPEGVSLRKLARKYRKKYQKELKTLDYGFQSVEDMVKSMCDVLYIIPSKNGLNVIMRQDTMTNTAKASLQIPVTSFGLSETRSLDAFSSELPPSLLQPLDPESSSDDQKELLKIELQRLVMCYSQGISLKKLTSIYRNIYWKELKPLDYGFQSVEDMVESMCDVLSELPACLLQPPGPSSSSGDKLSKVREEILNMLKNNISGIPVRKLVSAYKTFYDRPIQLKMYGLKSVEELLHIMKNEVYVQPTGMKRRVFETELLAVQLMEKLRSQILELFVTEPDGILETKLSEYYWKKYRRNLKTSSYGFNGIKELIESMDDVLDVVHVPGLGNIVKLRAQRDEQNKIKVGLSAFVPGAGVKSAETPIKSFPSPQLQVPAANPKVQPIDHQNIDGSVAAGQSSAFPAFSSTASEDFPELDTKLTKLKLRKLKEEELKKKRSKHRYPQNYYMQVREELNSLMQEVETLASDNLVRQGNRLVDLEHANQRAEEFIRALAAEGEHVTEDKVLNRVCRYFRVQNIKSLGIWPPIKLPAIRELRQTQREISTFIEAFESVRCICTLYELNQCLAALKNKQNFEELNLGPLCKQPLVHRMFKVPQSLKDEDIFEIETVDILQSLNAYKRSLRAVKIDLAEFIKYLADQFHCDSPYDLGIRITSIGLPISTLSKAANSERGALETAKNRIQREIEEEVQNRMNKIKKNLLDPASGPQLYSTSGCLDLRKQYASNTAAEAVLQVFINAKEVFSEKMAKYIQEFLVKVGDNRLARSLFQLAICCGSLEVPQDLVAKEKTSKPTVNGTGDKEAPLPCEGSVREYLQKNLSSVTGHLTLVSLSRLEKKLIEQFKLKGFVAMGHGTFLEYLVKHSQLLEEAAGGSLLLQPQGAGNCGFRPSHQDVYEFIRQCETLEESMFPAIEAALRSQFRVKDSKELGHGTLSNMIKMVQRQVKSHSGYNSFQSLVLYEATFFVKEASYCNTEANNSVGLLGDLSKEYALTCLLNTPLLEDLAEWSQWELVFEPQHGSLKGFIERYCGEKATQLSVEGSAVLNDLIAIEVKPGVLLRLTTDTSPELFAQAARSHDPIGTAGHLVSIVTADGLRNAPLALLANHVESALAILGSLEGNYLESERPSSDQAAKFIIDCLIRIPIRLCKSLFQKVFLEPFSRVVGQSESKQLLLETAKRSFRNLNRLHELGILLGITEWMRDYHLKLDSAKLMSVASKTLKTADSASLSSRSSFVGLSDEEDANIAVPESEIDIESESTYASSVAEDDDGEKFVLADEANDLPISDEKSSELTDNATILNGSPSDPTDLTNSEECSPDATGEEDNLYKSIIEDIRKNEFGIGVELTDEGKRLMQVHQNRLGRSLSRLSTELYSKDTHFVLELIQNADDNSYPPFDDDTTPSLLFMVERDCIILLNNECGFEEKNIRAICDVGCSTKGKHKYGYIGQKGIGFKSVFKVTDTPEIHSNGFHICFDKLSGPMGYILPHWIDDKKAVNLKGSDAEKTRWTTKIVLPLKPQNQQMQNLFHDIDPSLLLFLHRLRSITIINKVKGQDFLVTRKDLGNDILEVKHNSGADHWLVVKSTLDARKIKDNVECTELALAFKLDTEKRNQGSRSQPEKQPVFAFLPLRSFGFRFIIQGDFDIPSSREDIDRDSPWNQWLRSEIPQLFLKAMETFNSHPSFEGLEGLCHFLPFIPLPDEILDFFRPVAGQIIQILKAKSCLPTTEDKAGRIEYRLPSQIAVTHDILVQEVITPELLEKHLNLAYLNPVLQSALSPALVSALGIHKLSSTDIIAVTKAIAKEFAETNSVFNDDKMKKIAKLLVCIYRSLEQEYGNVDQFLEDLKSVPIIPVADGSMASQKDQAIFFPLYDKENEQFARPIPGLQNLYLDLKTIHPSVLTCLDNLGNSQVRKLLEKMDVHYLKPDKVTYEHILPILKEQRWKSKPQGVVISYSVFLKMYCQENELQQFRPYIPVLTNIGFTCSLQVNVNFTRDYKNAIDLPVDLPGVDWVLLDSCYLRTDNDLEGWRTFFSSLGVQDSFIFQKKKCTFTKQELASSPWAPVYECWPKTADDMYVVEDHVCEELHGLLTTVDLSETLKLKQRINLLRLLDRNWEPGSRLSQYCSAKVFNSQDIVLRNDVDSSFAIYLKTLPWLPTNSPAVDGSGFRIAYLRPIEVYLRSENLLELLANNVSYVYCDLLEKSGFAAFTGIKTSITVEMMINHFKSWCMKSPPSESGELVGAEFHTSADHIYTVYAYLGRNCSRSQLKELFERYPAVFVPSSESIGTGKFYHLKDVCWNDPTKIFQRYKCKIQEANESFQEPHLLAPFYGKREDMKDLFQKSLNIEKIPSMKHYVNLLVMICDTVSLPNNPVLQDVSVIYAILAEKCKNYNDYDDSWELAKSYCQTLKGMIKDERIFPAKDNRWVSLASSPIVPDNKHLERIFKAHSLCLLTVPAAERNRSHTKNSSKQEIRFNEEDRNLFFEICGVDQLSNCVTVEAQTEDFRPCPRVQNFVRSITPFIQRWFYHHSDFNSVYKELQDSNIAAALKSMAFYQVGKLYLYYQLTLPNASPVFEKEDIVCHLKNKKTFYIQKDHITSFIDICRELVKLFSLDNKELEKELERFLQSLISCFEDTNTLERFLKKEDVSELPKDEENWEVPLATEIKAEPRFADKVVTQMQVQSTISTDNQKNKDNSADGERTLASWPPKSSLHAFPDAAPNKAVEAVLRMWPPPAPPSDTVDKVPSGSYQHPPGHQLAASQMDGQTNIPTTASPRPSADQTQRLERQNSQNHPSPTVHVDPPATSEKEVNSVQTDPACLQPTESKTPDRPPATNNNHSSEESSLPVSVANSNHFNGAATSTFRTALPLDAPVWTKEQPHEEALEELLIHGMVEKPEAVIFNEDKVDNTAIGEWGERLVHGFLMHWKESDSKLRPSAVDWVNEKGESGLPYDFRVVFTSVCQEQVDTFIEVKSTVKAEKNFIQLSAQEVDLALQAKDHYHLYRVYRAGDSQNVKLCRIKNLAQCLHAKQLELFLYV